MFMDEGKILMEDLPEKLWEHRHQPLDLTTSGFEITFAIQGL